MSKGADGGSLGLFWVIGWLFTLGFLKQGFWKGVLGLIVWPYFLGVHLADGAADESGAVQPPAQVETQ